MPRFYRRRRWGRRRRRLYRRFRRRRRRFRRRSFPRFVGFPKTRAIRLRYVESVLTPVSSSVGTVYIFSANSIQDPNRTGSGHQPLGHDEWSAFYNHYLVVGSKIVAKFFTAEQSAAYNQPITCVVALTDDLLTTTTSNTALENPRVKWRHLPTAQTHGPASTTVRNKFSAKEFYNVSKLKDNVNRIGSAFGANPDDEAYFILKTFVTDANVPAVTADVRCQVMIDYLVILSEPKELATS